jgi:endonuclease YncB( thermonuclease family)
MVRIRPLALLGWVVCGAAMLCAPVAVAQTASPAVITHVIDGDTVNARLTDGSDVIVRLIGIDAPEILPATECGGDQAADALEQLVEGRDVTLVSDPAHGTMDPRGRLFFYVDRSDGLDVAEEMLRRGWAEVSVDRAFERLARYQATARESRALGNGVRERCSKSAEAFVRRFYASVSRRRFATAWSMLSRRVRRDIGPFRRWRAGHRRSLGVAVTFTRPRLSGGRAVVSVGLRARDRDACGGRIVRQRFRGRWILAPDGGSWTVLRVKVRKTGGGRVRLSKSECRPAPRREPSTPPPPPPTRPPPPPPPDCQGYSPCLAPGPDVDCAGGSGNGPRYVEGPVRVRGSDPYDLDSDGDGLACES